MDRKDIENINKLLKQNDEYEESLIYLYELKTSIEEGNLFKRALVNITKIEDGMNICLNHFDLNLDEIILLIEYKEQQLLKNRDILWDTYKIKVDIKIGFKTYLLLRRESL